MGSASRAQAEWAKSDRGRKALGEAKQREWTEADEKAGTDHLPHRLSKPKPSGKRYKPLGDLNFTSHRGRK